VLLIKKFNEEISNCMNHIELYKQVHSEDENYGDGGVMLFYTDEINDCILDTKSRSLLDYGCGKANRYVNNPYPVMPALYDPAIDEYSTLPDGPFDGVFCCDVLEHIPEEEIPDTIHKIYSRATKFVFLAISTNLAYKVLPNGENAHCTIKPVDWWRDTIVRYAPKKVFTHLLLAGQYESHELLFEYFVTQG